MSARRTRATSRRSESHESPEGLLTRQTRSGSKRMEKARTDIPQRGTRRRRRRSLESIATSDLSNSAAVRTTPDRHPDMIPEGEDAEEMAAAEAAAASATAAAAVATANSDSQNDSYEDKSARLQDMLDFDLPKLQRWCEKTHEALSDLTHPDPTAQARRNFNATEKSFKAARRALAEDGAVYIDLSSFDLPYQDHPHSYATVQKAVDSANLISLLLSLVDVRLSKRTFLSFLQELDDAFVAFPHSNVPSESERNDVAFFVRCRLLIELLHEKPDIQPPVLASTIFCEQPASTSEEAKQRLSQGPFRKFSGSDMEQDDDFTSSNLFEAQMDQIITMISSPQNPGTEEPLNVAFPRNELLEKLWAWALNTYIHVNMTAGESNASPNGQEARETSTDLGRDEPEALDLSGDEQLEEKESSDSDSSSGMEYDQLQIRTDGKSVIQDQATLEAVKRVERGGSKRPTIEQTPDQKSARGARTESEIGDAIRGLDAADVLSPIDAGTARPPHSSPSRSNSKRPREDSDDEDDDDDDFEVNEQLVDESMRVWHDTPREARRNRSRFSADVRQPRGGRFSRDVNRASPSVRERVVTPSQVAHINRMATANRVKPRQTRERWSDADTDRLLDLIADEELNCSWAAIEKKGGFQTARNQQAIRDKARNLKKAYLCADAPLPTGFDHVYLGKKERDEVIAAGRNPDRMEDDMDEDGGVINSELVEESS
ncbi:hypothetical protein GGR50DRAFT_599461 [Xylaria sp. CBS 124048]|nr:hypothetical protein GGR50DRAFT_599461 [Xylaria sp. CBS 124048]